MFGDKMLLGQFEVSVDDKYRIFLPSKTNYEKDDQLVLMFDSMIDCYRIYNIDTIKKQFEELERLILTAKSDDEEKVYKIKLLHFYKSILKVCDVDFQGRIMLGNDFHHKEKVLLIGANNHLILERKKEKSI